MSGPVISLTQETSIQLVAGVSPIIDLELASEVDAQVVVADGDPQVIITLVVETAVFP